MCEKREVLLKNSNILSGKLIGEINSFLEYEKTDRIRVIVISSEEKLKSKACFALETQTDYLIEGYSTGQIDVNLKDLILADYIIIHTAAIRMAPLQLTNALRIVQKFNKKAFVIIDKWNMLLQSKENVDKVRKSAINDFSMINVINVFNIGEKNDLDFLSMEEIVQRISQSIDLDFLQVRKQQADKIYNYYLDVIEQECVEVKGNANDVRGKIEKYITNVSGFHKANVVKIKSVCSELNLYSRDLYDKWRLISVEEYIGGQDCDDTEELRKHIQNEYINCIMSNYNELTDIVKENYKRKLQSLRENVLNEVYQIKDKIEGLQYMDTKLLEEFATDIEELDSIDTVMKKIIDLLNANTEQLEKKVRLIAGRVFDEETLDGRLGKRLEELADKFKCEGESIQQKVQKEAAIRKYYGNVIEKCNIQLFSEVDVFVDVLKKNINKKSEKILDTYYVKLEKKMLEIETAVEKEYIVV
ncbi:MAG: hypothetical protein IJA34_07150 [Lachnospiraceae bacterium]|nr:hypothetical protein [Lachnospiraceae bacterium]